MFIQYPRFWQTLEDWHSSANELRTEVYYKLSSLPRQTGLVVFWGPGSAINPSGHWHMYDPTVLLHVSSERHVSGCRHSSISKTIKQKHEILLEISQKSATFDITWCHKIPRTHVCGRVIWLTVVWFSDTDKKDQEIGKITYYNVFDVIVRTNLHCFHIRLHDNKVDQHQSFKVEMI